MENNQPRKFEEDLADLESLVANIDSGELSLEESISAFERGVMLVRTLNQKLDEVDRRVEVLTRGPHDQLRTSIYQGAVETSDDEPDDGEVD